MMKLFKVSNTTRSVNYLALDENQARDIAIKFKLCRNVSKLKIEEKEPEIFNDFSKVQELKKLMKKDIPGELYYRINFPDTKWDIVPFTSSTQTK